MKKYRSGIWNDTVMMQKPLTAARKKIAFIFTTQVKCRLIIVPRKMDWYSLFDAVKFCCTYVIADDRLTAENNADNDVDNNGEYLCRNADDRDRDVGAIVRSGAVSYKNRVTQHRDNQ